MTKKQVNKLIKEIDKIIKFHRENKEDPYNIDVGMMAAFSSLKGAILAATAIPKKK